MGTRGSLQIPGKQEKTGLPGATPTVTQPLTHSSCSASARRRLAAGTAVGFSCSHHPCLLLAESSSQALPCGANPRVHSVCRAMRSVRKLRDSVERFNRSRVRQRVKFHGRAHPRPRCPVKWQGCGSPEATPQP